MAGLGCSSIALGSLGQVICFLRVGDKETEHVSVLCKGAGGGGRRQEVGQMEIR